MAVGQKVVGALLFAAGASWLAGCGEGLGECNEAALGGDPATGAAYAGQEAVARNCASGRCHSEGAVGEARWGAPSELNFDVVGSDLVALNRNVATAIDWAEDMWQEILAGRMPPPKPAGSGELNDADKEAIRNWLACGAPAIASSSSGTTWDSIWPELATHCTGCHSSTTAAAGGGFVLGDDACSSYNNIFMIASINATCGIRVTAGNPSASLLYQKITGTQPVGCGLPMPPTGRPMGLNDSEPELVARIQQWIMNGAQPPTCP